MDRPGVRQVPEGSGEQGKMEKTGCKIIFGAPTTLVVKVLMMMMMMMLMMMWPSGKALGWKAEGPRFDPLWLSFLFKNCGLWTLSCDFAHTINETLKWLTQLPALMQSFWW